MSIPLEPRSLDELRDAILGAALVIPMGNRTKARLCELEDATQVSLKYLSGIIEYEPSEFTFTAYAGTQVSEVAAVLKEQGQYLPFDPKLAESGATLGGVVASGTAGSGSFRYGTIRDFILGVRFFDGVGGLLAGGGKVVKNAAGFDLPKFLVGSLGRFGVLVELTFKVFPHPLSFTTLSLPCQTHEQAKTRMAKAAKSRWELDAIDYDGKEKKIFMRLGGPQEANTKIASEIRSAWGATEQVGQEAADSFWRETNELSWGAQADCLIKVPTSPAKFPALLSQLEATEGTAARSMVAGNCVWISAGMDSMDSVDKTLKGLGLCGLALQGESKSIWVGRRVKQDIESAVRSVFDPQGRFGEL